jgi:uncharacterized membrane protein YbhN (UPF0104 family)
MKNNLILKYIGYGLGLLSFYYIYLAIRDSELNWSVVQASIQGYDYFLILFSLTSYIVVMFIGSILWAWFIKISSPEQNSMIGSLILVHAKSNLAKYLPGNFMHIIGRNVLGGKIGYKNSKIFLATLFEMFYLVITGFLIVIFMYLNGMTQIHLNSMFLQNNLSQILIVSFAVILIMLLVLFRKKIISLIKSYNLKDQIIKTWIIASSGYIIAYLFLGMSNLFLFAVLTDNSIESMDYINILFVYVISWLLGFIVPGPPGGLGVREAIYILLLSSHYDLLIVTTLALLLRVMNILGDILYFLMSMALFNKSNHTNK